MPKNIVYCTYEQYLSLLNNTTVGGHSLDKTANIYLVQPEDLVKVHNYLTTPPTENNPTPDSVRLVLLNSTTYPAANVTKYNGYIYMWY